VSGITLIYVSSNQVSDRIASAALPFCHGNEYSDCGVRGKPADVREVFSVFYIHSPKFT